MQLLINKYLSSNYYVKMDEDGGPITYSIYEYNTNKNIHWRYILESIKNIFYLDGDEDFLKIYVNNWVGLNNKNVILTDYWQRPKPFLWALTFPIATYTLAVDNYNNNNYNYDGIMINETKETSL